MDVASSLCNGDRSSKRSTAGQEPNSMDKDGGILTIEPSLQLELKLPWLTGTELEAAGNINEAKSRRGLSAEGAAAGGANGSCDDIKPCSSSSHSMTAEKGSQRRRNESEVERGRGRKKLRLSKEQSRYLEESFKEHTTPNPKQKLAISKRLNLGPRQVEVWFQNRRARTKLKQTEVDYEYLKQWCEYLTEENQRLHREIQELNAFEFPLQNAHHYGLPTMLAVCPSCQRAFGHQNT